MPSESPSRPEELAAAYELECQRETIANIGLGCRMGMVLMPAGFLLDLFVYPHRVWDFLALRFICSLLIGILWLVARRPALAPHYKVLGIILAMFPAGCISWMIYSEGGMDSTYYAGLNLVLLVIGFIVHWTWRESLCATLLVCFMYLAACAGHPSGVALRENSILANNLFFLATTGLIVVFGSHHHSLLRYAQFAAKFEIDRQGRQLAESNRQLEDSKQMLEESNNKLLEMDRVKSRFFANISHELRTPLTLLIAPLDALMARGRAAVGAEEHEMLSTMQTNGMRLLKLINDLLDLVRLESGKMEVKRERTQVREFLEGLAKSLERVAMDRGLKLVTLVDADVPPVLSDRDKLEKVILNLAFNAIKFTPSGGQVTLRSYRVEEEWILLVEDTGVGIAEEDMSKVFTRFWQADSSAQRRFQGAGIGLALVKELVEVQGGSVSLESHRGKGTRVTVRLPLLAAPEQEAVQDGVADAAAPGSEWIQTLYRRAELFPTLASPRDGVKRVEQVRRGGKPVALVADDEPDMLRFLKSQLSPYYQVVEAADGAQAVEKAAQFLPEVILLDMMMPEKDGLQVCRELRDRTPTQRIPIVLLTARADDETKFAALQAGASDFLSKPFSTTELHVRLRNLVDSHDHQRKLFRQNQVLESTIEQLKETEMQLIQSEKLASLGRMSAGIIHEINNPLNFAKTALHIIRAQAPNLPEEQREMFLEATADLREGLERVQKIVSDLRSFTHPNMDHFEEVQIEYLVASALKFTSAERKENVEIVEEFAPGAVVQGNKHLLGQVVLNLLQNSLDALKKKSFPTGGPKIVIKGVAADGEYRLAVRDNGPGIRDGDMVKIFDPFFTTKDVGEGMGLGLSICHRIMRAHDGRIEVQSVPGEFCEVALVFQARLEKAMAG